MELQELARSAEATKAKAGTRALVISALGPLTSLGGLIWAIAQPYRITLLHPHHQGFWWLLVEPPLLDAGGHIVKRMGDGIMAVFADPLTAVRATSALRWMRSRASPRRCSRSDKESSST